MAEKQKAMIAKTKEVERQQQEELLTKKGCPIQKAEKAFFEYIAKITEERTEKEKELRQATFVLGIVCNYEKYSKKIKHQPKFSHI